MARSIAISFEDLGVVPCNASNKRKMERPIFAKTYYDSIPIFYRTGYIFRNANNPKQYYSMEQLQELFKNYVENIH